MSAGEELVHFLLTRILEEEEMAREATLLPQGVERVTARGTETSRQQWPTNPADPLAEPLGTWGWNGGPIDHDDPETAKLDEIFGSEQRTGVEYLPYRIVEGAAWDEEEPVGASYIVAEVPGRNRGVGRHIVNWAPARVLAECEAKRRIVRNAQSWAVSGSSEQSDDTLRLLALPYADHPDYREEWRS